MTIVTWHYEPFDGVRFETTHTEAMADEIARLLIGDAVATRQDITISIRPMDTIASAIKSAMGA